MTSRHKRGVRRGLALLAAGTLFGACAAAAAGQAPAYPPGAVVQPLPGNDGAGAELRRYLSDLAANPRSVASLIGAGRAAIQVGDGQAALGFFSRAEEIAPRDARVKAGMASAFVLLEQPQAAVRFFAEAAQLGAPEMEIARDRGLAYDMLGNPRRAQQDYALVLQRGDDAEVRRRLALSLAISGQRDAALRALDPLLRRQDRAALRTRAFVLALTGDANGAAVAVQSAMPGQAMAMAPFLARLAGLNPAQKAMAVHFGRFPADGRPVQMAEAVDTSAHPAAVALTGGGRADRNQRPLARPVPQPQQPGVRRRATASSTATPAPRRRPGPADSAIAERVGPGSRAVRRTLSPPRTQAPAAARPQQQTRTAAATPLRTPARTPVQTAPTTTPARTPAQSASATTPARPPAATATPAPWTLAPATNVARTAPPIVLPGGTAAPPASATETAPTSPQPGFSTPAETAPSSAPAPQQQQSAPPPAPSILPVDLPPASVDEGVVSTPAAAAQASASEPTPAPTASAPAASTTAPPLADIAALVQALPEPASAPSRPARQPAAAASPPARTAARTTATVRPAPPPHPSRHWVQLAGGDRAAFAYQLARIRQGAPELLQGRPAWWAENGSSNRLLVGPFATSAEAHAFVNQLARRQVDSFTWTSRAGEEVERLPAR